MRVFSIHLLVILLLLNNAVQADDPSPLEFRDDFDGKYDEAWTILNENAENISLTKNTGMLTITTEKGGIWRQYHNVKNIFLIDTPMTSGNFVMTTHIVDFDPQQPYQQAGLICFNDIDNYVKLALEFDAGNGGKTLAVVPEIDGMDLENATLKVKEVVRDLWLRIVLYDGKYIFSASRDGKNYRTIARQKCDLDYPAMVGIIAKNGAANSPGVDAKFDLFEIVPLETKPELIELIEAEMVF